MYFSTTKREPFAISLLTLTLGFRAESIDFSDRPKPHELEGKNTIRRDYQYSLVHTP
jgi:hypothetical protein